MSRFTGNMAKRLKRVFNKRYAVSKKEIPAPAGILIRLEQKSACIR